MFDHLLKPIANEFSGKRAWLDVNRLWQFRNTVCTPTMREACRYCVGRFRANGLSGARMVPYAADGETAHGVTVLPPEWDPRSATLDIVQPAAHARRVTSLEENVLALMSRSGPTPGNGIEAELVVLNDGTKPEHYEGLDVKGKLVMTERQGYGVAALARERGAVGIVSDTFDRPAPAFHERPMRESFDAPDAVQWNCLPGVGPTRGMFGFVVSPRIGQRLRRLVAESSAPVVLRAHVDARLFKGHSDVVDAVVKGRGREELWVLAHISEPGAYDNASGLAVSIEIARTLKALVRSGALPPMKRSVRFLFSTEVSGFMPYLEERRSRLPQVAAGLCIDSVGVDLGAGAAGQFMIYQSPDYAASYIEDLLGEIAERISDMRTDWFGEDNYSVMPWRYEPFWGNDAFVTDPYYDIPTAQLSCWPYRYYHTSQDMPHCLSPDNLARSGVLCATFLYFLACAGEDEARWLSSLSAAKGKTRVADALHAELWRQRDAWGEGRPSPAKLTASAGGIRQCRHYFASAEADRVRQPAGLAPASRRKSAFFENMVGTVEESAAVEERAALRALADLAGASETPTPRAPRPPKALAEEAQRLVPRRNSWRPFPENKMPEAVQTGLKELRERAAAKKVDLNAVWPWADGKRDLLRIWGVVRYKTPCSLGLLVDWFKLLEEGGAVEFV